MPSPADLIKATLVPTWEDDDWISERIPWPTWPNAAPASALGGHHGKAAPLLVRPRRLHGGVERQDVGLEGQHVDHANDLVHAVRGDLDGLGTERDGFLHRPGAGFGHVTHGDGLIVDAGRGSARSAPRCWQVARTRPVVCATLTACCSVRADSSSLPSQRSRPRVTRAASLPPGPPPWRIRPPPCCAAGPPGHRARPFRASCRPRAGCRPTFTQRIEAAHIDGEALCKTTSR